MHDNLLQECTAQEVEKIIYQMNLLGSPRPNGFLVAFYQNHWEIVGQGVCKSVIEAFNSTSWNLELNATHITLIPKVKRPQIVNKF